MSESDLRAAGSLKWTYFPDSIGAFVAEMDFGVAPAISEAVAHALDTGLTGYLPPELALALSEATATWYSDHYGWTVPPERVHHVPDVVAAYEWSILHDTQPGAAVIVPTPAYMPFLTVPEAHGRRVIEVPSIDQGGRMILDLAAIAQAFDDGGELIAFCNPHNPLGTVFTREEMHELSRIVQQKNGRVFSDEIHAPLIYAPARHIPYASISEVAAGHAFTATSASKAWNLAGFKCAQIILSNDHDADRWAAHSAGISHGTSTIGVVASIAAYTRGEQWLNDVVAYLERNRQRLAEVVARDLPRASVSFPEGTYIALIDFREYNLRGDLAEWFRENARVSMTDGAACGVAGIGFTRFVFALPLPLMEEGISRIAAALNAREA